MTSPLRYEGNCPRCRQFISVDNVDEVEGYDCPKCRRKIPTPKHFGEVEKHGNPDMVIEIPVFEESPDPVMRRKIRIGKIETEGVYGVPVKPTKKKATKKKKKNVKKKT